MSFTTLPELRDAKAERDTLRKQLDAAMRLLERAVPYANEGNGGTALAAEMMAFLEAGPEVKDQPDRWLVWSNEHGAWWRPNECGYCLNASEAGRYTKEQADEICQHRRSHEAGKPPPEVAVRESDVIRGTWRPAA